MQFGRMMRVSMLVTIAALVAAAVATSSRAQTADPPEPPPVPPVPGADARGGEALAEWRGELQSVYEDLFALQVRFQSAGGDSALLDSLAFAREALRDRVDELSDRIAAENALRREQGLVPAPPRRGDADVYPLLEQLSRLGSEDPGPGQIAQILEHADGLPEVIAILGEQLKDLDVDVSSKRVRIETSSGSRLSFTVPEELREELSAGMREIGRELNNSRSDSTEGVSTWTAILRKLPEHFETSGQDSRHRRRKIIGESAFSMGNDFRVEEDEVVQGDVLVIGGNAEIAGEVQGNVYVIGGSVLVEGRGLVVKTAASIGGRVGVEAGGEVTGHRMDFAKLQSALGMAPAHGMTGWGLYLGRLAVLLAGILLVYGLFGDRMEVMVSRAGIRPGHSMAIGSVWTIEVFGSFVLAAVGLVVSVIGIPVVMVLAVVLILVSLMAYLTGCELLGRRILHSLRPGSSGDPAWRAAMVGAALLELPAIAALVAGMLASQAVVVTPLRALEFVLRFLSLAIGFGAVIHTRLGRRRPEPTEPLQGQGPLAASA